MRTGILVGACGLALAGVAEAQRSSTSADGAQAKTSEAKPVIRNDFTARRDAVVGAPGSRRRLLVENDIRQMLREGRIDPRRVTLTGVIDEVIGGRGVEVLGREQSPYGTIPDSSSRSTRAGIPGNPNPWADTLDADDFLESFTTQANGGVYDPHLRLDPAINDNGTPDNEDDDFSNRVPLAGQNAPNGNTWGAAADFIGVIDQSKVDTGDRWNPGGTGQARQGTVLDGTTTPAVDPNGERGDFFVNPRGSIAEQPERTGNFFDGRLSHTLYAPDPDEPVVTTVADLFLDDIDTFVWWRPVSFTEGFIVTNVFLGGFDFQYFAPFTNDANIADRLIILGLKPGSFTQGEFFGARTHKIKTQEWINVALRQTVNSFSVWVRDSTTIGVNGFEQGDNVADGAPADDTQGAFIGEIFEQDWLQFYPGMEDDPATPLEEGNGVAFNLFQQLPEVSFDATESPAADVLFAFAVDALQIISGSDPTQDLVPGHAPNDYYYDNHTVMGKPFPVPDPVPDFVIPFLDDIELWNEGPLSVQSDQWFDFTESEIIIGAANSNSGVQHVRQIARIEDQIFRESFTRDVPIAEPGTGVDEEVDFSIFVKRSQSAQSRGVFLQDPDVLRIIMGGRDQNGIVDNRVYVRIENPDFNDDVPQDDIQSINLVHDTSLNRQFINVPLADSGGAPITLPDNEFIKIGAKISQTAEGTAEIQVFINDNEGFLDPTGLGFTTPPTAITDNQLSFGEVAIWSGNELQGLFARIWVDDYFIDGPRPLQADVLTADGDPFANDPPFSLPYEDPFETYGDQVSINNQGTTPWLETLFTDTGSQVDVIPLESGATVDTDTFGYFYTVDEVLVGSLSDTDGNPVAAGDRVFVVNNIPRTLPPDPAPLPGAASGTTATRAKFRSLTNFPQLVSEYDWILERTTDAQGDPVFLRPWDGSTPVLGRYFATFDERWATIASEDLLIADPTGSGRGQVLSFVNTFTSGDAGTGDLDGILGSLLPTARTTGGATVTLAFDLWVGIDASANGPRGRFAWFLNGPDAQPGNIAQVVFGGPNNYLDNVGFDEETGAITQGADGFIDNFLRGQPVTVGGSDTLSSDPTVMYVAVPNPNFGIGGVEGAPRVILSQTGYTIPANTWIRCTAEVSGNGNYTMTFDDGTTPFTVSGAAIDETLGDVRGTDSLNLSAGFDDGADGLAPTRPLAFMPLGPSAVPEGGTAPLSDFATVSGMFNETVNPEYFYFEVNEIFATGTNEGIRPMIQDVDVVTGTLGDVRELALDDVIVLWNDKSTTAFGGTAGERFSNRIARPGSFMITENGTDVTVRGNWTPMGLPGDAGLNDPAPNGGVAFTSPPYNSDDPFRNMLMGSIVDFPEEVAAPLDGRSEWLVDNVRLERSVACPGNLVTSTPEAVDGADLAALLGAWGSNDPEADLTGDGTVDGADLASLLGAWGVCP